MPFVYQQRLHPSMPTDITKVISLPIRPAYGAGRVLREKAIALLLQWERLGTGDMPVDPALHAKLVHETRQIREAVVASEQRRYEALQLQVSQALEGLKNQDLTQAQQALQVLRDLVRD